MTSVAFAFTPSTDSNLVPFNAGLMFGNKQKSHEARLGEYGGCSNMVILCFVKNALTRCVPERCLGGEPSSRSSTFQVFFFLPVQEDLSKPPCVRPGERFDLQAPNPDSKLRLAEFFVFLCF